MRENPAVIPKRGVFFVHDNRDNNSNVTTQEVEDEGEAEDASVGRWRADALPSARKRGGGDTWCVARSRLA